MIVADHMNQVNLSCEAEGNPSVSFIWFKEPDMNNQLSTEHLLMIYDLSANKSGFSHGIYSPFATLTVSVMLYTYLL
jgi:hypothetical protein